MRSSVSFYLLHVIHCFAQHRISNHSFSMTGLCLTLELSQFWWMTTPNLRYVICNVSCLMRSCYIAVVLTLVLCSLTVCCTVFARAVCFGTQRMKNFKSNAVREHTSILWPVFMVFFFVNILHSLLETKVKLSFSLFNDSAYTRATGRICICSFSMSY